MKKNNYIPQTLLTVTLLLASCGGEKHKSVTDNSPAVAVKVGSVATGDISQFVTASGKIEAEKSANVSTRMMGYVTKLYVKMGERVKAGQILASLQNTDLQAKKAQVEASILQATAGYNNAKKDYERFVALFNQQSASEKELDDMTSRYEMAKAGLEGAKQMKNEVMAQFSYTNITAPFSGIVTNTFVKEGDMANPGMPLVSVESPSKLQVTAMVSESDIQNIQNGMAVLVLVKSRDQKLQGKVSEVSGSSKNTGGQYLVKINLDSTDNSILSGMFVNVQFPIGRSENSVTTDRVLVPEEALVKQGQLTGIYTVGDSNVAMLRWLRTGKTFGDQVEVLSGLAPGESYIVSADGKLYNGAKVSM